MKRKVSSADCCLRNNNSHINCNSRKSWRRDQINCETTAWSLCNASLYEGFRWNLFEGENLPCSLTSTFYYYRAEETLSRAQCAKGDEEMLREMSQGRQAKKLGKFEAGWWKLMSYQNGIVFAHLLGSIHLRVGNIVDSKLNFKIAAIECGENNEACGADDGLTLSTMILVYSATAKFDLFWHLKFDIGVNKATAESWVLINSSNDSKCEARWSEKRISCLQWDSNTRRRRFGHDLNLFACYWWGILKD